MKDIKINSQDFVALLRLYYCDYTKAEFREILKQLGFESDSSGAEGMIDLDCVLNPKYSINEGRKQIDDIYTNSDIVKTIA